MKYSIIPHVASLWLFVTSPPPRVHIRRTDKLAREASFHSLDEYMQHVEHFYRRRQFREPGSGDQRRCVYLASDDPSVFQEAAKK